MSARVLHVITTLDTGGAEMMLYKLLSRTRHDAAVVSMTTVGSIGERLQGRGVPVSALRMTNGVPDPRGAWRLAKLIRERRPQVVQTWMYHADVLGGVTARLFRRLPVVWNIRQSNLDPQKSKRATILTARACGPLSRWVPRRIVCCSEVARQMHAGLGYEEKKIVVIPNGFDLDVLRPDPSARDAVRRELGLRAETPLVGLIARFDPQKDHRTFLEAAGILHGRVPEVHFVLAGQGVNDSNLELRRWVATVGLDGRVHLLGRRDDAARLTAALDVATSSSAYGEGFPNTVGEAMALEVPCVVTEVGDSGLILGDGGMVVPPRDPAALAEGWRTLLLLHPAERARIGRRARERVARLYSLEHVVVQYENLYEEVIANGSTCAE